MRLAAIDLDGTLLRSDGTISQRSRTAIRAVRDLGIVVVIVTARGPASVTELATDAGIVGSAICSNGGLIVDLASGAVLRELLLETETAIQLVHALRERLPGIVFAVEHEAFAHEPGFSAWGWEPPAGTRVANALELLEAPATKLILRHTGHEVEAIAAVARELAGGNATVVQSGGEAVEVTAVGVNKAAGLAEVAAETGTKAHTLIGTMIEVPRAALTAGQIAQAAEFFSFGTNDLTQMGWGFSRDDVEGSFFSRYIDLGVFGVSPFETLDADGIGRLVRIAVEEGRATRPDLKIGVCGEHGGDPESVHFFHNAGLDYVSCSPFRVPVARLEAGRAAVEEATGASDSR